MMPALYKEHVLETFVVERLKHISQNNKTIGTTAIRPFLPPKSFKVFGLTMMMIMMITMIMMLYSATPILVSLFFFTHINTVQVLLNIHDAMRVVVDDHVAASPLSLPTWDLEEDTATPTISLVNSSTPQRRATMYARTTLLNLNLSNEHEVMVVAFLPKKESFSKMLRKRPTMKSTVQTVTIEKICKLNRSLWNAMTILILPCIVDDTDSCCVEPKSKTGLLAAIRRRQRLLVQDTPPQKGTEIVLLFQVLR
jgi:hypothetical protein